MKFLSYDTKEKKEFLTEIRATDVSAIKAYIQTWVPDYLMRVLRDTDFYYQLFEWDRILKLSYVVGFPWRCYGAYTNYRLDGLLCLGVEGENLKIEYIATAPWNYTHEDAGKMRRIGSGLICFTIKSSIDTKRQGRLLLNALPDAEGFYDRIGMRPTGNMNDSGLKEYEMQTDGASSFLKKFEKYLVV